MLQQKCLALSQQWKGHLLHIKKSLPRKWKLKRYLKFWVHTTGMSKTWNIHFRQRVLILIFQVSNILLNGVCISYSDCLAALCVWLACVSDFYYADTHLYCVKHKCLDSKFSILKSSFLLEYNVKSHNWFCHKVFFMTLFSCLFFEVCFLNFFLLIVSGFVCISAGWNKWRY